MTFSFAVETTTYEFSSTSTTEDPLDNLYPDFFSTTEFSTTVDYEESFNETTPGWETTEFYLTSPEPFGKTNPCVS